MSPLRPYKKEKYHKKSTRDLSHLKQVVDPELKKSSDEMIKALVNNLNRNTTKKTIPQLVCEAIYDQLTKHI